MNRRSILTKTGKGLMEATGKTSDLSRDLRNILKEIDGKVRVSDLLKTFEKIPQRELGEALRNLEREGYVREFIGQQDGGPRSPIGRPATPPAPSGAGEDLDFTDFTPAEPSAATTSEDARLEAQAEASRMREEAAAKAKAEAERRAGPSAEARAKTEAQARAQAEALDQARREAEERQRRQAEEKARLEADARARIEAEQALKPGAEAHAPRRGDERALREDAQRREAEERARRELEERMRREEAERVARIEAETRAKVEAEMRARREFEERARREEEERSRREADLRRLAEEEQARKRRDAEESEALMRSLREQEEKVQQEAGQREREEKERGEREERTRLESEERARRESDEEARRKEEEKRDEEKEKRTREEEKTRADSEAEEAAKVRKAARAKERAGEQATRVREEAVRDSSAAAQSARKAWAKRKPGSFVRQLAAMLLVLLAISVAVIPFVSLESGPYEKAAQAWLGEPVRIGTFNLVLLPMPRLKFEKVVIGKEPQIRVATIRATPEIGSVLAERKAFKSLELENVTFPREYLPALLPGKSKGGSLGVEHLTAKGVKLDIPELNLPAFELDASFSPDGALKTVTLVSADRKLSVKLQPQGGKAAVEISSDKFPLPIGADLALGEFTAKGTVTRSELALNEAEARAFGGRLFGSARLRWSDGWSLEGEFAARQIDAVRIAGPLVAGGTLEGRGVYSMKALLPERLLMNARLDGNFTVQKGSISNVDMTRLLQSSGPGGGTTLFSEMSGSVSADPNRILVRHIRMVAGLLSAAGQVEMDPQKNLSGRLQIELRARTVQARATVAVAGTLKNPQFRRTN
jgi:hypothetical protein